MKSISATILFVFLANTLFCQEEKNYELNIYIDKKYNKYQYDFQYLYHLCELVFPKIDLKFPKNEREKYRIEILERLSRNDVDDLIFWINCSKFLSKLENQHSYLLFEFKNFEKLEIFPISIFYNKGKFFLQNINSNYQIEYVGKEITHINNIPIKKVFEKLSQVSTAENDISKIQFLRVNLVYTIPIVYKELGIFDNTENLKLKFIDNDTITVSKMRVTEKNFHKLKFVQNQITKKDSLLRPYTYSLLDNNIAYLKFSACMDKQGMYDGIEDYVSPMFQSIAKKRLDKQYRIEKIDDFDPRVKGYINKDFPLFKDFLDDFFGVVKNKGVNKLIIDLRGNEGGEVRLTYQLLYYLSKSDSLLNYLYTFKNSEVNEYYFKRDIENLRQLFKSKSNLVIERDSNFIYSQSVFKDIKNIKSPYYIDESRNVFNGKIVVLANYLTGSSAALLTTLLQDNNLATIIGTSVGNNPTGATQLTSFTLPKSKRTISIASLYLERPNSVKEKVQIPDYWIENSLDSIINGVDELLNKAIELE